MSASQKKRLYRFFLLAGLFMGFLHCCFAQEDLINPRWLHGFWKAHWISPAGLDGNEFAVCHFRKAFSLDEKPSKFIIHVSGDNRYRLYINGRSVGTGPARSDLANWNYETYDIAPFLQKGINLVAATVWNFAQYRPYSQISFQTGFLLQGDGPKEEILNSNKSWKAVRDSAYSALPFDMSVLRTYIVTAQGERLNGNHYRWGFEQVAFDDARWTTATELWYGAKSRSFGTDGNWMLVPRTIPLAEETPQRFGTIRRSNITVPNPAAFLEGSQPLLIPAHTHAKLLFDQSYLTNAYPTVSMSGGAQSKLQMSYAEAMLDPNQRKGNRDSIAGKELIGYADEYIADGGTNRIYTPLFFRTFRYLQLDIETGNESLTINDFHSIFTGYPFKENAYFKSDAKELQQVWNVGWRTARLCAVDTYFDCPYYEQLQYVGDTRIQSLISLYVSGDDRLVKKAISDISHSFFADGLTQSRYPSRDMQVIPTFSLWWVCMIHDYWMHRKDDDFIRSQLPVVKNVLEWYRQKLAVNGMLGPLSWWQFVDWSWEGIDSVELGGVPPGVSKGGSSIVSLQYAYTLRRAAQLMNQFGEKSMADQYNAQALAITDNTYRLCWDAGKGLLADDYRKKAFSQHANIMAVLTDAIPMAEQKNLIEKIIGNKDITPCTYYFTFYLFEALKKVELGDRFLDLLRPWSDMLKIGLSTFAEQPEPTRSDCHAWSASPNYEMLSLVCGIRPAAPGFEKVLIAPYPGKLQWIEGKVPLPQGDIRMKMDNAKSKGSAEIELPPGISGEFSWQGKKYPLGPGKQTISW